MHFSLRIEVSWPPVSKRGTRSVSGQTGWAKDHLRSRKGKVVRPDMSDMGDFLS